METNELKYKIVKAYNENGVKCELEVTISLGDPCNNKHCDFSVTGNMYENYKWCLGGPIHNEICKHFPQFEMLTKLHLCNHEGVPMYAIDNGMYILENKDKQAAISYLRLTENEYNILVKIKERDYFKYQLYNLGIVDRWKNEADNAIKTLEQLTGNTWVNPYNEEIERHAMKLTDKERYIIEERINSGYYSEMTMKDREEMKRKNEIERMQKEINERYDKDINKLEIKRKIELYILNSGVLTTNYIYYDSNNEIVFNWLDYKNDKISQEEFVDFINRVDYSQLPEGITFKIKE